MEILRQDLHFDNRISFPRSIIGNAIGCYPKDLNKARGGSNPSVGAISFLSSSIGRLREAVNFKVPGSSPGGGANLF